MDFKLLRCKTDTMHSLIATHISDNINLETYMQECTDELLQFNHLELFYEIDTEVYASIFRYGVVCFFNFNPDRINNFTDKLSNHCNFFVDNELTKEYVLDINSPQLKFGIKNAGLTYFDIETLRVIMLNLSQAVALDFYFQKTRVLLEATNQYTSLLAVKGKIDLSDKELRKFIGKTHQLKNEIVENLHIFRSLPDSQKTDYLIQVDQGMKTMLFMDKRFNNIYKELEIISEHLEYFNNMLQHSSSMKLEWIIIVLLGIFVFNILLNYFK